MGALDVIANGNRLKLRGRAAERSSRDSDLSVTEDLQLDLKVAFMHDPHQTWQSWKKKKDGGEIAVSGWAWLTEMYPHRLSVVVRIKACTDLKEKSFAFIHPSIHPSHMLEPEFLTDSRLIRWFQVIDWPGETQLMLLPLLIKIGPVAACMYQWGSICRNHSWRTYKNVRIPACRSTSFIESKTTRFNSTPFLGAAH